MITIIDVDGKRIETPMPAGKNVIEYANGIIGYVAPIYLTVPFGKVMLVDEDAQSKRLKLNQAASILAGQTILGKVILCDISLLN